MTTRRDKRSPRLLAGAALLACAASLCLTGCRSDSAMSDKEVSNFKGGPMPAGFLDKHNGPKPVGATPSPAASTAQEKK